MSTIDRALIKHRLRSRTNPMAMLVAETQFLAGALNKARTEAERQTCRADLLLQHIQAANANFAPDEDTQPPSLPLAERSARQQAGMASGHPEYLTTDLGDAPEEMLAALADRTWPADEYEDVTADGDAA
jgi:hypothetical protein